MSAFETVEVTHHGAVAVVQLNRPAQLNAFSTQLRDELRLALEAVNADPAIRVGILTGAGRGFSAGADLGETMGETVDVRVALKEGYKPALQAISEAPKPWISAVNGPAAGIGSAFAMACDLTVMADDAYLYQAFTAISLVPDGGATWHLLHTLGRKRAYEFIATGEKVTAQKCLELGLCNRVVPAEALLDETLAWAQELAERAPLSLRYAKEALGFAATGSLADTIDHEADLQHICINSDDAKEGVAAFMQKRAARFSGR